MSPALYGNQKRAIKPVLKTFEIQKKKIKSVLKTTNFSPKKADDQKVSLNETKEEEFKLSTFKGFIGADRNVSFHIDD